jgi:hypothetical protein
MAELIRGHWAGSEIRNHWARDACMREDRTRSKNHNLNCALAALRICLIPLKAEHYPERSWPELQENSQRHPDLPIKLIVKNQAKSRFK